MTAAASASPTATPAVSAGAAAPATTGAVSTPTSSKKSKSSVGPGVYMTAIAVISASVYMGIKEYVKSTPHGAASFQAEMRARVEIKKAQVQSDQEETKQAEIKNRCN